MILKVTILLLVLVYLTKRIHSQGMTIEEIINNTFRKNTTTPTPVTESPNVGNVTYKSCGLDKECVPQHLCADGAINTDGSGLINIRIDDSICRYNELCCDIHKKRTEPVIPAIPSVIHQGCGWRNKYGIGYKISGANNNEAEFGEFPWMVAIVRSMDVGNEIILEYHCGGSLIAKNVVLTAAHCVINREANELVVRAGEWDTHDTNEILPHADRRVQEIIRHERFNRGALHNDVALLILSDPFELQENIRPICLPESNVNFDYSRCYATGWGKDSFDGNAQYQAILKKVDLPIVPHATCQANLRQTRLGLRYNLHESFICAGGEKGKDTCKGDGGSPLVCPVPGTADRFYQAGIVAFGVGCGEENVPGVYASVSYLRSWILDKLSAKGISFEDFTA
ncbi:phenoloxidase-activating factor 2-like [Musca autumnalis]|uniref:phenoloxidase-activating factor 2-like n=1 Tax=Musca autumnalis TaxID=221902 RepID=UPI003CF8A136